MSATANRPDADAPAVVRVVLVDDHAILRQALGAMLTELAGVAVVGEAGSAEEALEVVAEKQPDIVLMDLTMPGMGGIAGTERIRREHPQVRIVVLSMHEDEEHVKRALVAGASGYVLKTAEAPELQTALRAAAQGQVYLSEPARERVVMGYVRMASEHRSPLSLLTPRQREVLQGIAEGLSTKELAYRLQVSTKTVETHRAQLMERLDIHDIAGLVRFAVRHRLVRSDE